MSELLRDSAARRPLVLWDGECALCRRAAARCQEIDVADRLEVVAYQDAPSPPMTESLRRACADALHVIDGEGGVLRAGRALLFILGALGYPRTARVLGSVPLVWGVELVYRAVAHNRQRISRFVFRAGRG